MPRLNSKPAAKGIIFSGLFLFFCLFSTNAFAANYKPAVGTITPASGTSNPYQAVSFTTTYSDSNGWQDIKSANLLINTSANGTNCFYGYYNRATNKLYLRNNVNSAWLGGFAPRSANIIENSYCKLDCSKSSVTGSGKTLSINWSISFKTTFTGTKYTYLLAQDNVKASSGWIRKGILKIAANSLPAVGAITPSSGSTVVNAPVTFTATYSDANSWQDINSVYLLINASVNRANCFYSYYNRAANKLYLRNNANTAWLGGYRPSSSNIIENSYVKLDCSKTTVSGSGNILTVKWAVTFKSTFLGSKNTYLYISDDTGAYQGWVNKGTIAIKITQPVDITSPTGTIKINNDAQYTNSAPVTLNLSAQDNVGGSGLSQMQFSNNNSTWSTPENYATTKIWTLSSIEGIKTVYVKYKDVAGNWSQAYSDTITLDTAPPVISLNSVLTPTNKNVTLSYFVSDNFTPADKIVVTGDNSPYTTEGLHNVTLTAKDLAGNTVSVSIRFTINKAAPVVIITSPQNGAVVEDSPVQLKGTVDGVAFSESRALNFGENTLTKTATGSAGNTSSASVTVYLYMGELVGLGGGTVVSQDGKVKVVIPSGALTTPTRIRISKISNNTLKNATPAGKILLSAVECKPYSLVFTKPVKIAYSLDQAAVPGTPVELGLYDARQGKIIPTGQATVIPKDGYTVSFSLTHFSTYAALGYSTPQGTPIGGGVKIPLPDIFTGAFSHAIPITVPPGRKGMQPAIALSYRSSNSNSWVGLGFSLNLGYIVRSTRLGSPAYNDTQDTFYLVTDAGTTELAYLIDNLYQAKIESSFTKFFKETDNSWRVVAKDGAVLRFGQDSNSKETSSGGTFSWYLTKAVDTNGNYIQYSYIKDQGKSYLSRIDYTGNENGISPANSIEFYLESRNDISSSYISTSKIATAKRLREIQVKAGYDLAWRYVLEYAYSTDTNRSLLKSIVQSGSDGKSLPAQAFSYQQAK